MYGKYKGWDNDNQKMITEGIVVCDGTAYKDYRDFENGISIDMELLEYSGLQDKSGAEIYNGDILILSSKTFNGSTIVDVISRDGCFLINGTQTDMYGEMFLCEVAHGIEVLEASHYCEVIGNIYENKDLMEGN